MASDGTEAWNQIQQDAALSLVILDWMMPGMDGVEVTRRLRASRREPYVYVLLLTARNTTEEIVEGMEAGADDYLTKPFDNHELRVRLRAGRRILDLQTELLEAREALRDQANRDALTGLRNRRYIFEVVERELARARRQAGSVSVVMADIDRFKVINDTWGHLAGDAVLREAARRIKSAIRAYDEVGRYGGEEFLMVLPDCDCPAGGAQAERIRAALGSEPVQVPETGSLSISASFGVSCSLEDCGADELIRRADAALYTAKRKGRNRVEVAPHAPEPAPSAAGMMTVAW